MTGICISQESSFVCICDAGFTGRFCEFDLNALKCCSPDEPAELATTTLASTFAIAPNATTNQGKCAAVRNPVNFWSAYDTSLISSSNNICKSNSRCKNLILGGVVCDKCGAANGNRADNSFYNKFCELRAKHFPAEQAAFLALPGIKNRFRFNVRLTFATRKSSGYLLHNSRLDNGGSDNAHDFISLRIVKGFLVFAFSLGARESTEITIANVSVTDGKWRTVGVSYKDHKFALTLDDDNRGEVNACDMAHNSMGGSELVDCFRVEAEHKLAAKCSSQMETCYRYFDMNGPLVLGRRSPLGKHASRRLSEKEKLASFEGCISDVYVNERMVDLGTEAIIDHRYNN